MIERELLDAIEKAVRSMPEGCSDCAPAVLAVYLDQVALHFLRRWGSGRRIAAAADRLRGGPPDAANPPQ